LGNGLLFLTLAKEAQESEFQKSEVDFIEQRDKALAKVKEQILYLVLICYLAISSSQMQDTSTFHLLKMVLFFIIIWCLTENPQLFKTLLSGCTDFSPRPL